MATHRKFSVLRVTLLVSAALVLGPAVCTNAVEPNATSALHPGIWGIDFSPDGKWMAVAYNLRGKGGPIVVYDTSDWTEQLVRFEEDGGLHVAFSPNCKLLASSTRGTDVTTINVPSWELARNLEAHDNSVFCVAFTPDSKSLLSSSSDRKVKLWDVATGDLQRTFDGHGDSVDGVAVSPDGELMLTACNDRLARLWDFKSGEVKQTFGPRSTIVRRARFSHDGRFFLVSSWDAHSRVHETDTGAVRIMTGGGSDCADLTADNRFLATVGNGSTAHAFRVNLQPPTEVQRREIAELIERFADNDYDVREAASAKIVDMGLVAEPQLSAAMRSDDAEVRIRSRFLRRQVRSPVPSAELAGHAGDVEYVRFSPNGKLLATGCRGGDLKIWSVSDFELVTTLHAPSRPE